MNKVKIKSGLLYTALMIAGLIIITCASQAPPSGGPEDKSPPFVIYTEPAPDSTNVSPDVRVVIGFSEAVDHRSCQESIFITPYSGDDLKYKWSGRRLAITFPRPLDPDRTYVITVGTGTKDLRNNTMKDSYSLAFSTGDKLDVAAVNGMVYGENEVTGTQIWAYDLNSNPAPDPSNDFPLYITQVGKDGSYSLSYMAFSNYRLFAVMDRDMNTLYDKQFDLLGVGLADVILCDSASAVDACNFRIAMRDTTPPILRTVNAVDQFHLDLRFSEAMRPDSLINPDNYLLYSVFDTLQVLDVYQDLNKAYTVHITTNEQLPDTTYRVQVFNGYDLAGFALGPDTLDIQFMGSAVPDTTGPLFLAMDPADSSRNVMPDTTFRFFFSDIMDRESVETGFVLADTLGDTLSGDFEWKNGASFNFIPHRDLGPETFYLLTLPVDSTVFDIFGNPLADTLFQKRINTINPDTLSEIAGTLYDKDSTATGPLQLVAKKVKGKENVLWLEQEGEFRFKRLMPGDYVLSVFRDRDGNGSYSMGEAYPFEPAERFYVYPDTISIRSRWPNEGEIIVLPSY